MKPHDPVNCSADCKKFLYLKHDAMGSVPPMKHAHYLDTRKVYELPLRCLYKHRHNEVTPLQLRHCSFSLITDLARDPIAVHLTSWQPRPEMEVLYHKINPARLEENGLICWVDPASKELKDENGTSYTGCGPCVVLQRSSSVVTICVVSTKDTSIFVKADKGTDLGLRRLTRGQQKIQQPQR